MATKRNVVGANKSAYAVYEDIKCKLVACFGRSSNCAKVRSACQCFPAGLLVENLLRLVWCSVGFRAKNVGWLLRVLSDQEKLTLLICRSFVLDGLSAPTLLA